MYTELQKESHNLGTYEPLMLVQALTLAKEWGLPIHLAGVTRFSKVTLATVGNTDLHDFWKAVPNVVMPEEGWYITTLSVDEGVEFLSMAAELGLACSYENTGTSISIRSTDTPERISSFLRRIGTKDVCKVCGNEIRWTGKY